MSKDAPNPGFVFYRQYYQQIEDPEKHSAGDKTRYEAVLNRHNKTLFTAALSTYAGAAWPAVAPPDAALAARPFFQFDLETTYPGLFTGAGVSHETGALGEIKLGFQFDYSTGLPVIPGSTVKGCLRHALEQLLRAARTHPDQVLAYLQGSKGFPALDTPALAPWLKALIETSFEGPDHPYRRDVFLDAFPVSTENAGQGFLGPDFITPHGDNPLKNPIPVQFMKILPGVQIRFSFRLHAFSFEGTGLHDEAKAALFKKLLLDWGIGAKSRSGYGRLAETIPDWQRIVAPPRITLPTSTQPASRMPGKTGMSSGGHAQQKRKSPGASKRSSGGDESRLRSIREVKKGDILEAKVLGLAGERVKLELPIQEKKDYKRKFPDPARILGRKTLRVKITNVSLVDFSVNFEPIDS